MANLFSGQPKIVPEFTGLQINTAVQVLPIPLIYGCQRVPINLIYFNGFNVQEISQSGKGILTGGKGPKTVEYFATIIMAIGEGPLGQPLIIYQDSEVWTPATFPSNGAYYYNGTDTQAPWPYAATKWPNDARPYKDTAYYGFANAQLDSSATVPQINVVVQGFFTGTSPLNHSSITITSGQYDQEGNPLSFLGTIVLGDADADPAQVIYDLLTNAKHGAGFPANFIDTTTLFTSPNGYNSAIGDSALSTFCQAVGLAWSMHLSNAENGNSILSRLLKNLNVAIVWNGAVLKFIPYWDQAASGNPGWDSANGIMLKYFVPYLTPQATITLDQILQSESKGEEPIVFMRKDPVETYNTVRLDYNDRNNFWNDNTVEAKDEAHIELFGPRIDNIGQADEFTLGVYANVSAQMQLRRNISIVRTFTWKMGPLWGWIDPMDIFYIPDPANYANNVLVRIVSVEDDADENVTIMAEEFPIGSQSPTVIPTSPTTPPNQGATNSPPSPIYPPVMFAPTTAMLTATGFASPQWIFGCSAGFDGAFDSNWGGAEIWVSLDNASYQLLGSITGPAAVGTVAEPIAGGVGALYVNMSESGLPLASVSPALASSGYSICVLSDVSGFEIIAYTTATLSAPNTYALTGLYRGLYGTTARGFGAGSMFMLVGHGANLFETTLPSAYVGQQFWVKAASFNVFRSATQDLSSCVAYTYLATGPTPAPPVAPPMQGSRTRRPAGAPAPLASPRRLRH